MAHKEKTGSVVNFPGAKNITNESSWSSTSRCASLGAGKCHHRDRNARARQGQESAQSWPSGPTTPARRRISSTRTGVYVISRFSLQRRRRDGSRTLRWCRTPTVTIGGRRRSRAAGQKDDGSVPCRARGSPGAQSAQSSGGVPGGGESRGRSGQVARLGVGLTYTSERSDRLTTAPLFP